MKITGNFQAITSKKQELKKYNSNPFANTQFDSINFEGSNAQNKKPFTRKLKELAVRTGAFFSALMTLFSSTGCANTNQKTEPTETTLPSSYVSEYNEADRGTAQTETQQAVADILEQNYFFQEKQDLDGVSLTFDYTDNHSYDVYSPKSEATTITQKGGNKNLREVITNLYGVKDNDENEEVMNLIAQAIVKSNPWMAQCIDTSSEEYNYADSDITFVDPQVLLDTDYLEGKSTTNVIELPKVNAYVDTKNYEDSRVATSKNVEFISRNRDDNNLSTIKFSKDEVEYMQENPAGILDYVEDKLANEYEITSMESYAGDAIWHGIALWEDNEEIFEHAGEDEIKSALVDYVKENDSLEIACPRIAVTFMVDEDSKYDEHSEMFRMLTTPNPDRKDVKISYLSNKEAVYQFEENQKTFRPIDVLDSINFPGGESIKDLLGDEYEDRDEKYDGIALAAFKQIADNNNFLFEKYGNLDNLTVEDLYEEVEIADLGSCSFKASEIKGINLQPIAIVKFDGQVTPDVPTQAPTQAPTTAPTEAPTTAPTMAPTEAPTQDPTTAPDEPTVAPTVAPTATPTVAPTEAPTELPTCPTWEPELPTCPTWEPELPTCPTWEPELPTCPTWEPELPTCPTWEPELPTCPTWTPPTCPPTCPPVVEPTAAPEDPTECPDLPDVTPSDTPIDPEEPTMPDVPTDCPDVPEVIPTDEPVNPEPTMPNPPVVEPTEAPTIAPTVTPEEPTNCPSQPETDYDDGIDAGDGGADFEDEVPETPTQAPTVAPDEPTVAPTVAPEDDNMDAGDGGADFEDEVPETPTQAPTVAPTEAPTEAPDHGDDNFDTEGGGADFEDEVPETPTQAPTTAPTEAPTTAPTETPTQAPTEAPTVVPDVPTDCPEMEEQPDGSDDNFDTEGGGADFEDEVPETPTQAPTTAPTEAPTQAPTSAPEVQPETDYDDESGSDNQGSQDNDDSSSDDIVDSDDDMEAEDGGAGFDDFEDFDGDLI